MRLLVSKLIQISIQKLKSYLEARFQILVSENQLFKKLIDFFTWIFSLFREHTQLRCSLCESIVDQKQNNKQQEISINTGSQHQYHPIWCLNMLYKISSPVFSTLYREHFLSYPQHSISAWRASTLQMMVTKHQQQS